MAAKAATNWWMVGYNAAMKAGNPSQIDDALGKSAAKTEHQKRLFIDGWRSVWRCERAGEVS